MRCDLRLGGRKCWDCKFVKDLFPFFRVLLRNDESIEALVKGEHVLQWSERQTAKMVFGKIVQRVGIGLI